MISIFGVIWLLHVAALITPGPNVLLVSHIAASGSRRSASYAAIGVAIGAAIWSTAAVLGVRALFAEYPVVRRSLQVVGAAYLLYIGFRLCRSPSAAARKSDSLNAIQALRGGLFTNLSNPKSALFFGSVFAAVLPAQSSALMLAAAVGIVVLNALCWHLLLAFLFSHDTVRAGYAMQHKPIRRVAGTVIGALGVFLLVASMRDASR